MNWQAILIEEAQTNIKLQIKDYIIGADNYARVLSRVKKIIAETIKELESEELKVTAKQTLENFTRQLMLKAFINAGITENLMVMAFSQLSTGSKFKDIIKTYSTTIPKQVFEVAVPNQVYQEEYMKQVEKIYEELAKAEPMYDENISLRNIAEMTVRYDKTMADIQGFIDRGVNLVVSSIHANCSVRCQKWQGGHYTLDNTYRTVDGIQFQPLSNATSGEDAIYTTKKGKTYINGHITGYNCRHYLMEYKKGFEQVPVSAEVVERQRAIDHKMRYMERQVREWKDKALIYKGVNNDKYLKAREKAKIYNQRYIEFAKSNNRAYYPSRTDVF